MIYYGRDIYSPSLYHYGIKGQSWGKRRFQNEDGSLTEAGKKRYYQKSPDGSYVKNGITYYNDPRPGTVKEIDVNGKVRYASIHDLDKEYKRKKNEALLASSSEERSRVVSIAKSTSSLLKNIDDTLGEQRKKKGVKKRVASSVKSAISQGKKMADDILKKLKK